MIISTRVSPGDFSLQLPDVAPGDASAAVESANLAQAGWAGLPLDARIEHLRACQKALDGARADLARGIAVETGKPIRECAGELGAVVAKFDFTIADARRFLAEEAPSDAPHPSVIRRRPRGPAAVIGPFNFPIHLPHGQIVAYLIAGNTVIFKPSPLAAGVCSAYARLMQAHLPQGVFGLVPGGAAEAQALCGDPRVRAVGFTGSVAAGKAIARACAEDLGKDLALELGGKCAAVVCADADLQRAADQCAEAACLTAGQRCNATSRIIVDRAIRAEFTEKFVAALSKYQPGDPLNEATRLGALVSQSSRERYQRLIEGNAGHWLKRGHVPGIVDGKVGFYADSAAVLFETAQAASGAALWKEEMFVPIVAVATVDGDDEAVELHNASLFGLTASVYTRSRERFSQLADRLEAGNIYANLPTTLSPSQLPFGGWKDSGNGRPGGRGFVRFTTDEQAIQTAADGFG